jgi:pimeloyl-ACP methyl ester carboxylesterase
MLVKLFNRSLLPTILLFSSAAKSPYQPPGKLIDVGGYRVHLNCTGEGRPTVFIGGGFSFDWDLVQPSIAKFTKVCTYDVSGTAWSDPGPPLTCSERVNEIHRLLKAAGIERPFVFVGFSIGALVGRAYASLYPDELAGMVMVDHAFLPFGGDSPSVNTDTPSAPGVDSPPVLIYKTPIVLSVEETSDFGKLPERSRELHRWAVSLKPVLATAETAKECLSLLKSPGQNPPLLGNLPLVVVSTSNDTAGYEKLQNELLSLSSNSKQLIAARSFHSVEIDEPDVVIDGIRQVVKAAQDHTKLK